LVIDETVLCVYISMVTLIDLILLAVLSTVRGTQYTRVMFQVSSSISCRCFYLPH